MGNRRLVGHDSGVPPHPRARKRPQSSAQPAGKHRRATESTAGNAPHDTQNDTTGHHRPQVPPTHLAGSARHFGFFDADGAADADRVADRVVNADRVAESVAGAVRVAERVAEVDFVTVGVLVTVRELVFVTVDDFVSVFDLLGEPVPVVVGGGVRLAVLDACVVCVGVFVGDARVPVRDGAAEAVSDGDAVPLVVMMVLPATLRMP